MIGIPFGRECDLYHRIVDHLVVLYWQLVFEFGLGNSRSTGTPCKNNKKPGR